MKYSLLDPNTEPSDEQLKVIMADALKDVIEESKKADLKMKLRINELKLAAIKKNSIKNIEN